MTSNLESSFTLLWNDYCRNINSNILLIPTAEYKFHNERRWRFDFAWPAVKVAVEIEGGIFSGGRHTRGTGYEKDLEKYNTAITLGWKVYRLSGGMLLKDHATWIPVILATINKTAQDNYLITPAPLK